MREGGGIGRIGEVRLAVVKLGGSIITQKNVPFTPNLEAIRRISSEVGRLYRLGWRFVIVLGGGSYGHPVAHEYMYSGLMATGEALSAITRAMLELSEVFAEVASEYGLNPVIYPPHAFCKPRGLKPNCCWDVVRRAFWYDATPIVYGDAYPGYVSVQIISGDELAVEAACELGAERLIYLTDVPGVYDGEGQLIPLLTRAGLQELLEHESIGGSTAVDVTGGMRRKLQAILELGCQGLKAVIGAGTKPETLALALEGRREAGTWVEL